MRETQIPATTFVRAESSPLPKQIQQIQQTQHQQRRPHPASGGYQQSHDMFSVQQQSAPSLDSAALQSPLAMHQNGPSARPFNQINVYGNFLGSMYQNSTHNGGIGYPSQQPRRTHRSQQLPEDYLPSQGSSDFGSSSQGPGSSGVIPGSFSSGFTSHNTPNNTHQTRFSASEATQRYPSNLNMSPPGMPPRNINNVADMVRAPLASGVSRPQPHSVSHQQTPAQSPTGHPSLITNTTTTRRMSVNPQDIMNMQGGASMNTRRPSLSREEALAQANASRSPPSHVQTPQQTAVRSSNNFHLAPNGGPARESIRPASASPMAAANARALVQEMRFQQQQYQRSQQHQQYQQYQQYQKQQQQQQQQRSMATSGSGTPFRQDWQRNNPISHPSATLANNSPSHAGAGTKREVSEEGQTGAQHKRQRVGGNSQVNPQVAQSSTPSRNGTHGMVPAQQRPNMTPATLARVRGGTQTAGQPRTQFPNSQRRGGSSQSNTRRAGSSTSTAPNSLPPAPTRPSNANRPSTVYPRGGTAHPQPQSSNSNLAVPNARGAPAAGSRSGAAHTTPRPSNTIPATATNTSTSPAANPRSGGAHAIQQSPNPNPAAANNSGSGQPTNTVPQPTAVQTALGALRPAPEHMSAETWTQVEYLGAPPRPAFIPWTKSVNSESAEDRKKRESFEMSLNLAYEVNKWSLERDAALGLPPRDLITMCGLEGKARGSVEVQMVAEGLQREADAGDREARHRLNWMIGHGLMRAPLRSENGAGDDKVVVGPGEGD